VSVPLPRGYVLLPNLKTSDFLPFPVLSPLPNRYAEFPKLRQIDALRPYLIKYGLFPPRRDPDTAPIRFQELKLLVRKWNLHQERNFWSHHTTKEGKTKRRVSAEYYE